MKRIVSLLAALALCLALLAACSAGGGASEVPAEGNKAAEDAFKLADFSNPFLGEWQSEIPSANTTLKFNFKEDGTFDYEMAGVPADQGGKGSGGYAVLGDIQITWLDFEGAAAYTFKVVDNNTINVTELEFDENGTKKPGDTSPFTRVEGAGVNTKNVPLKLNNIFIGKLQSEIPSAGTVMFDYKADGSFDYEIPGAPADQGGKGSGAYLIFGDKMVSYLDFEGISSYSFKEADKDTINVTELEPNDKGELVPGDTAAFTRVKQ